MTKKNKPLPSRKRLLELFNYDPKSGHLTWRINHSARAREGARAGGVKDEDGYRRVSIDGIRYHEHRIIYRICTGIDAGDFDVDHDNWCTSDNRIANLRVATRSRNSTHLFETRGCSYIKKKKKWAAQIMKNGKNTHLGAWTTEQIARAVYATAARRLFKEFAPKPPPNPFGFENQHWGTFHLPHARCQ